VEVQQTHPQQLNRELGLFGASIFGLATMIGTGIFVSLGLAAGISGPGVILALVLAGVAAVINSLNDIQLSVNNPVSGGVYEYGYQYLTPWLGFTGGWVYLLARTTAGATAALGFAGYLLKLLNIEQQGLLVPTALVVVFILTVIANTGLKYSRTTTVVTVSITLLSLLLLVLFGILNWPTDGFEHLNFSQIDTENWLGNLLQASALMFVAYGGYGRIATMGEEILEPKKNIPKAIAVTIAMTMVLYIAVAIISLGAIGTKALGEATSLQAAPLQVVAESFGVPGFPFFLTIGALTAMLSVPLSGILGLSRVLLAMSRRGDMPNFITRLNNKGTTPYLAVIAVGSLIGLLVLIGDVKATWSFSAFANLNRGLITALAALNMSDEERLYPRWVSWLGLIPCLFLLFCIGWDVFLIGMGVIGLGLIWHFSAVWFKLNPVGTVN
jgi:basic amino acid/polyamine antiporter, APA family